MSLESGLQWEKRMLKPKQMREESFKSDSDYEDNDSIVKTKGIEFFLKKATFLSQWSKIV